MEPSIRRWHTRYRAAGAGGNAVAQLERDVRSRAAVAYADALQTAFGHDPAVYVLRRLHVGLTVVNPSLADETAIAQRWGTRAVAAAARTIAHHGDDTSLVMRFESDAAFIARFLADLLDGVAWDRWYYAPFARYRGRAFAPIVLDVLAGARDALPEIFATLVRERRMHALVARLPPESAREVWEAVIAPVRAAQRPGEFRVFVLAAMSIVDALDAWQGSRPDESEVVARYEDTQPDLPDWREPRELARAVLAVLAFLRARAMVRPGRRTDIAALRAAIEPFEWLDRNLLEQSVASELAVAAIAPAEANDPVEALRVLVRVAIAIASALHLWADAPPDEDALIELYAASALAPPASNEPREITRAVLALLRVLRERGVVRARSIESRAALRAALASLRSLEPERIESALASWLETPEAIAMPASPRRQTFTAMQRRILGLVHELLRGGEFTLPDEAIDSDRNALAVFAALAAAEPSVAAHPSATGAIAWVLRLLAAEQTPSAWPLEQRLAQVIETVLDIEPPKQIDRAGRLLESRFAGLLLLTRGLLDARLPQLAAALGAVPFAGVLRQLAREWTGEEALDDALLFWAGSDGAGEAPVPAFEALRQAVERTMRDRIAFSPSLKVEDDLASNVVRLWASWLRGLSHSSVPWLLRQFILRPGALRIEAGTIAVSLAPAPLDAVLELSHYFDPIAAVSWLGDARLTFAIDRSLA